MSSCIMQPFHVTIYHTPTYVSQSDFVRGTHFKDRCHSHHLSPSKLSTACHGVGEEEGQWPSVPRVCVTGGARETSLEAW